MKRLYRKRINWKEELKDAKEKLKKFDDPKYVEEFINMQKEYYKSKIEECEENLMEEQK